jgi:hypothetical protein
LGVDGSENITVTGGNIIGIDCRTVLMENDACNITFDSVSVNSIGPLEGIGFINVKDILIVNSSITAIGTDLYLYGGSQIVVRNSAWTTTGFSDPISNLTEQHYLNMTIVNSKGDPIPNANVQIENSTGFQVFNEPTDPNGNIQLAILTEAVHNKTTSITHTPHNITVTAPGYNTWYADPVMVKTKSMYAILLKPGEKLTIHYTSDWDVNGTEEYWNETFLMDGNITVDFGETLILNNCTVFMNCSSFNGQYHIEVRTGGYLRILDNDWDNTTTDDASLISDSPYDVDNGSVFDYAYNFSADWNSMLEVRNSTIRECGWPSPNDWEQGICVYGNNAVFDHVDIYNKYKGIVLNRASLVRITYCNIMVNATYIDAVGIHGWDQSGSFIMYNTINMTGTGANQTAIMLYNNTNSYIFNNNVSLTSSTGWADGISIIVGRRNQVSGNSIIQDVSGTSIILWDTDMASIVYNDIQVNAFWSSAILVHGTKNSMIMENDLILNTMGAGISVQEDCSGTLVYNNTIYGNSNVIYGLHVINANSSFTIINNTINLKGMNSRGIHCEQSSLFSVQGLNITFSNLFSMGISISNCNNLSVSGANIFTPSTADASYGVSVQQSGDVFIGDINADLQHDFGAGIEFSNGVNNNYLISSNISTDSAFTPAFIGSDSSSIFMINSSLDASLTDDIQLFNNITVISLNTTFSDSSVTGPLTQLIVGWYLNVQVQNELGQPFADVNVRVERPDASVAYEGQTGQNGWIKWIMSLGYIQDSSTIDNSSNPHLINVSNSTSWAVRTVDLTNDGQNVIIKLVNDDPIITNPQSTIQLQEDSTGTWNFYTTDRENNPIKWSINSTTSWIELNSSSGKLKLTPNETHVGTHIFAIRATDINSGYDEFDVTITITNRAPVLQTANVLSATEDSLYSIDLDSDDDPATTWVLVNGPGWLTLDANTGLLSGTPLNNHVGVWNINISLEDGHGGTTWNNFSLTVNNNPPSILTNDIVTATEDQSYIVDYASTDDGHGSITWEMTSGPTWLSIDQSTGVLSGTPNNGHVGQWSVTIEVNDGNDGIDQHGFNINVKNTPPNILNNDSPWADEDVKYEVDYSSSDDSFGNMVWSLSTNTDSWLGIDPATGVLSGTPRNNDVGSYWVNVSVNDDHGGSSWQNFSLTINNTNDAPVIMTNNVLEATEDILYLVDYIAHDDDGDTVSWVLTTDADWLELDSKTGELSGTPTNLDVGSWEVTVSCADGKSGTANSNFNLTVININDAPVIEYYSPLEGYPTVEEGIELEFNITYSDEDSEVFTVEWTLDNIPVRSDVPFWTYKPAFESAGDHEVIVNITDSGGASVSQRWIVIVNSANRAPIINEFSPMNLKPVLDPDTSELIFSINATDPDNDILNYIWLINGVDTGERTNSYKLDRTLYDPGTYNLTVRVADDEETLSEQTWSVDVKPESSEKSESGDMTLIIALALIIVIVILLLIFIILKKKRSEIEDIFVISNAGILLAHKTKELRPDMDDNILSGMLTAIQDFIKDAFKDKTKFGLRRLDFGDSVIHLSRGNGYYIAVVLSGEEPKNLEDKLNKTNAKIQAKYGGVLANWKGNLSEVRGIKDELDELLK